MSKQTTEGNQLDYEGFKEPSPITCLVGVIVGVVILAAFWIGMIFIVPELASRLTYPLLALLLLLLAGGGIYYWWSSKRRQQREAAQAQKRETFEAWMDEELKEMAPPSTKATGDM